MHVIEGINFSIWSANDIRRESVVHITEKKTIESMRKPEHSSNGVLIRLRISGAIEKKHL